MICWLLACASPQGGVDTAPVDTAPVDTITNGCDGAPELCERTLAEITLPGTHNSMSNADAGWIYPNQQHGLTRQLEDGVRALMLDTWDWDGEPYLCHMYCELGAQPLDEGLGEIATFLQTYRREVVVIIFEDHLSVDASVAALQDAGLGALAITEPRGATLGALIEADTRLLITAEDEGPPPDWYHHAWDLYTDTPYSFETPEDFSCERNRGSADNPYLLVNHWISDPLPDPANADLVNQADVLEARARQCEEERGHTVNVLAVDYYDRGDLFDVVRRLNGL